MFKKEQSMVQNQVSKCEKEIYYLQNMKEICIVNNMVEYNSELRMD